MADRLSIGAAVEGFHIAAVVRGLDELGVFELMQSPATVADAATVAGVDAELLHVCLELVAGRTDLVEGDGERYCVTSAWDDYAQAYVRQYIGAYGRHSTEVAAVLREPGFGLDLVDRAAQALSYAGAPTVAGLVADLVVQLELKSVLDLGCGPATMLLDLAERDPEVVGWGVDASAEMCAAARERVAARGLDDRITIAEGDAFDPSALAERTSPDIRAITATSVLNELWGSRGHRPSVLAWLRALGATFPGRVLVVADYFGRLGRVPPPWPPQSAVHDLVQALSGQGIPPADDEPWRAAYTDAGAALLHMVEDEGRTFFIHLVRLPGER